MPWIENISLADIKKGLHFDAGINSMLIQIVDPCMEFPTPKHTFKETHQFEFLDTEDCNDDFALTDEQADIIVNLLKHAFDNYMNVVVHCHAGVCRSGAVAEVGVIMGFTDCEAFRSPNLLVKHKLMQALGLAYDVDEPHSINGVEVVEDWSTDNEKVFTLADARRKRRQQEGEV